MGKRRSITGLIFAAWILHACAAFGSGDVKTYARYVPESQGDFAWENDISAFRVYGPGSDDSVVDSGIDCWLKRVPHSIINNWYSLEYSGKSYQNDYGEGLDNYYVGKSAGCGGTALWLAGRRFPLGPFIKYEIKVRNRVRCVFTLIYSKEIGGVVYGEEKTITVERGNRLFHVKSVFKKNGEVARNLPVCVGLTTHGGSAITSHSLNNGWIACWEGLDDSELGTGVRLLSPIVSVVHHIRSDDLDKGHILLLARTDNNGAISYQAGYAWKKEGTFRNQQQWEAFLDNPVMRFKKKN